MSFHPLQVVDKVDGMQTVENFERQGAAESRLRSVFIIRDLSETKPATQYFVVCLQSGADELSSALY